MTKAKIIVRRSNIIERIRCASVGSQCYSWLKVTLFHLLFQLAAINRHVWVTASGKGELELELSMMDVVQTHVIPSVDAIDPDVLQAIASLGCFKERDKLIQELLSPK